MRPVQTNLRHSSKCVSRHPNVSLWPGVMFPDHCLILRYCMVSFAEKAERFAPNTIIVNDTKQQMRANTLAGIFIWRRCSRRIPERALRCYVVSWWLLRHRRIHVRPRHGVERGQRYAPVGQGVPRFHGGAGIWIRVAGESRLGGSGDRISGVRRPRTPDALLRWVAGCRTSCPLRNRRRGSLFDARCGSAGRTGPLRRIRRRPRSQLLRTERHFTRLEPGVTGARAIVVVG